VECKKQKRWEKSKDMEREGDNDGCKTPFNVDVKPKLRFLSWDASWSHLGGLKTISAWIPPPELLI